MGVHNSQRKGCSAFPPSPFPRPSRPESAVFSLLQITFEISKPEEWQIPIWIILGSTFGGLLLLALLVLALWKVRSIFGMDFGMDPCPAPHKNPQTLPQKFPKKFCFFSCSSGSSRAGAAGERQRGSRIPKGWSDSGAPSQLRRFPGS